jgi:hypothetical protein
VNKLLHIFGYALAAACAISASAASAQQSFYQRFRANNASMTAVQPSWMGPVIQSDARLGQAARFSVSNSACPGAHTIDYGNGHGFSVIMDRRFQFDFDAPAFFRNHSPEYKDGFGNAATQLKWRIASGNAEHGNYVVSAILYHGFSQGANQNGMSSSAWNPTLAAGRAFGRLALISNLGGVLPTANIWQQGRAIQWSTTAQFHPSSHIFFNLENNTTFNLGGPFNRNTQNFLTPAAYYVVRRRDWAPEHATVVFDCGMQVATTRFHQYNHNLVTEMRVFF